MKTKAVNRIKPQQPPFYTRRVYRGITLLFGLVLLGVGGYVVLALEHSQWLVTGFGVILLILGVDAVIAAIRGKEPLVSKIGPLP